jgi:flavin-dependent dehydrogenase
VTAATSRLKRVVGQNWLAVGDAAQTLDPLSSGGIATALESGVSASSTISKYQNGDSDALEEFETASKLEFEIYMARRYSHYSREQRWPNSAFWARRGSKDIAPNG